MRLLSWEYGVRNLLRQPLRTGLTALGLTLVVFLLLLVIGFLRGLDASLIESSDAAVAMVHFTGAADNLENSSISDQVPALVKGDLSSVLEHNGGMPALSPELVIATMVRAGNEAGKAELGLLRGVRPEVFLVRRQAFLTAGTWPQSGEILVGRLAAAKTGRSEEDLAVGKTLAIEGRAWRISGRFAAPGTTLEAEIWLPLDDLKLHMKRPNDISLVALRLAPQANLNDLRYFCARHLDLELAASTEAEYYASLKNHYRPLRGLAWLLVGLVACAGACGAINTMYAAVAGRVREFAALQAVGFPRRAILISLLQESVLLCALATLTAVGLALLLLRGVAVRFTMSAFTLELDPVALWLGTGAGLALGVLGAIPPAVRAFRLSIADALKAV